MDAETREREDIRLIVERIKRICGRSSTLGLATVGTDGSPHAANVNFVEDENLDLYFLSAAGTRHSLDVFGNPRVAATAYVPFDRAEQILGLQVHGQCEMLRDAEFNRVWQLFMRKFPYSAAFEERARAERFYRIRPSWFRVIDNSAGFGRKWEVAWPPRT